MSWSRRPRNDGKRAKPESQFNAEAPVAPWRSKRDHRETDFAEERCQKSRRVSREGEKVPQLDEWQLEDVERHLEENGGSLSLGLLSNKVKGLKKTQLEEFFNVELREPGRQGDYIVSFKQDVSSRRQQVNKTKKQYQNGPDIEDDWVEAMREVIEAHGGSMELTTLGGRFAGCRKVDIEQHFCIEKDDRGVNMVRLEVDSIDRSNDTRENQRQTRASAEEGGNTRRDMQRNQRRDRGTDSVVSKDGGNEFAEDVASMLATNYGSMDLNALVARLAGSGVTKVKLEDEGFFVRYAGSGKHTVSLYEPSRDVEAKIRALIEENNGSMDVRDIEDTMIVEKEDLYEHFYVVEYQTGKEIVWLDMVDAVRALLQDHSGSMDANVLTRKLRGVKLKQLPKGSFNVRRTNVDGKNKEVISLVGDGKCRDDPEENDEAIDVDDVVGAVRALLERHGGSMYLNALSKVIRGIKTQLLKKHFHVSWPRNKGKSPIVSMEPPSKSCDLDDESKKPSPTRNGNWIDEVHALLRGNRNAMPLDVILEKLPGVTSEQVDESFAVATNKKGIQMVSASYSVDDVRDLLEQNGGSMDMSSIANVFRFIKMSQLEEHFRVERDRPGVHIISLPDSSNLRTSGRTPRDRIKDVRDTSPKQHRSEVGREMKKRRDRLGQFAKRRMAADAKSAHRLPEANREKQMRGARRERERKHEGKQKEKNKRKKESGGAKVYEGARPKREPQPRMHEGSPRRKRKGIDEHGTSENEGACKGHGKRKGRSGKSGKQEEKAQLEKIQELLKANGGSMHLNEIQKELPTVSKEMLEHVRKFKVESFWDVCTVSLAERTGAEHRSHEDKYARGAKYQRRGDRPIDDVSYDRRRGNGSGHDDDNRDARKMCGEFRRGKRTRGERCRYSHRRRGSDARGSDDGARRERQIEALPTLCDKPRTLPWIREDRETSSDPLAEFFDERFK